MPKINNHSKGNILMMAGGTGGHVFPALAMAKELKNQGYDIHWLGTRKGIESRLIPKENIPLHIIDINGLRGSGFSSLILAPFRLFKSVYQSYQYIKQLNPVVVVGLGGFVTGPGGIAAKLKGIPLVIHEQNAIAGLTNTLLSKIADTVLQAFENTFSKGITTGNPIRKDIQTIPAKTRVGHEKLNILVIGGSLGAVALNTATIQSINKFMPEECPNIWHQVGDKNFESVIEEYKENNIDLESFDKIKVTAFIDDMSKAYEWADLVVCRSGALTVSEVACVGVAAIFVPYPHAVDDHQTENAQFLVKCGGAEMINQSKLTSDWLAERWAFYQFNKDALLLMSKNAKEKGLPSATDEAVLKVIEQISYFYDNENKFNESEH
jgi:UDP-N-acetylglucosamine--N-acetylmuramyl-(pentapeptide) pyrophosphoryl-undecaprenol N-acetylglucosamine transferase